MQEIGGQNTSLVADECLIRETNGAPPPQSMEPEQKYKSAPAFLIMGYTGTTAAFHDFIIFLEQEEELSAECVVVLSNSKSHQRSVPFNEDTNVALRQRRQLLYSFPEIEFISVKCRSFFSWLLVCETRFLD